MSSYTNEPLSDENKQFFKEFDAEYKIYLNQTDKDDDKIMKSTAFANMSYNNSEMINNLKNMLKTFCEFDDISFTNVIGSCYLMDLLDEECNKIYSIVFKQDKLFIYKF